MADAFRPVFDALHETAAALAQAGEASQQAMAASQQSIEALKRAGLRVMQIADAANEARDEHEDLRETIDELKALVISQGHDLKALRDRLDNR